MFYMKKIILLIITLYLNSCTRTINAWNDTPVAEYFEIYGKDDLPSKLKEKDIEFRCTDLVYSSEGYTKKCYVPKKSSEKLYDWKVKLYKTSEAMLLDTGENIIIIGSLILCGMIHGDCSKIDLNLSKK